MTAEIGAALLPDVKAYLQITWEDEATDRRILGMILRSAAYLDRKRGAPADYTQEGLALELLFERVRYARDNALDVFEANYRSELLSLQNGRRVELYAASVAAADQGRK
jgi:hypothetical protein